MLAVKHILGQVLNLSNVSIYAVLLLFTVSYLFEQYFGITTGTYFFTVGSIALFTLVPLVKHKITFPKQIGFILLLFVCWNLFSLFFSKDMGKSIVEVLRVISYASIFSVIYTILSDKKEQRQVFLYGFTVLSIVLFLYNFFVYLTDGEFKNSGYFAGSFYWHNQMAGFFLFLIPLLVQFVISEKSKIRKIIFGFFAIIAIIATGLTYSGGGWVSLFASLVLLAILNRKNIRNFKIISIITSLIIVIGLIGLLILQPKGLSQKIYSVGTDIFSAKKTVSGSLRTAVWANSITMMAHFPLTGVGPGAFGTAEMAFETQPWLYSAYAHNYFLQEGATIGVPGLLIILGLFFVLISTTLSHQKSLSDRKNMLLLGVIAGLFASTVHSFIDYDWSRMTLFMVFWIFCGLLIASLHQKNITLSLLGIRRILYIIPLVIMLYTLLLLQAERNFQRAQYEYNNHHLAIAELYVDAALRLNPYNNDYLNFLGTLLLNEKKFTQAAPVYEKMTKTDIFLSDSWTGLGQIALKDKNYPQAKKMFSKAIMISPYADTRPYLLLATSEISLHQNDQAIATLQMCINKAFPLNAAFTSFRYIYDYAGRTNELTQAYFMLAGLEMKQGHKQESAALAKIAISQLILPSFNGNNAFKNNIAE